MPYQHGVPQSPTNPVFPSLLLLPSWCHADTMVLTCRAEVVGQDDIVSGTTTSDNHGTASFRSVYRRSTPPKSW